MFILISMILAQEAIRPVNTYSIVAYDEVNGEIGVAVQSHWFSVGAVVPWVESGVGAVATQSLVDISYGPLGLAMMRAGKTPQQALEGLLASDPGSGLRQVAMIDVKGNLAAHTGELCIAEAGHRTGKNYSVQANIMVKDTVWAAMGDAFEHTDGDLAERMLAALDAAQAEGGDLRGMQSAALLVAKAKPSGFPWKDRIFDLRVEDHPQPLKELRRLVKVARAYHYMDRGDEHIGKGETAEAMEAYGSAMEIMPEQAEIAFWTAVTMATSGQLEASIPYFAKAYQKDPNLKTLLPRLVKSGLLGSLANDAEAMLRMSQGK